MKINRATGIVAVFALAAGALLAGLGSVHFHPLFQSAAKPHRYAAGRASPAWKPPFLSGVIEGFYGPSWSVADTLAIMRFERAHHMNTFLYAPKYDPYSRIDWREPYPSAAFAKLRALIKGARVSGIRFVYSVSPGLNITYSSQQDRAALLAKINQVRGAGVNEFMLSLDDIAGNLNAADNRRYHGNLAWAEADLANYVWNQERRLDPHFRLLLAQTDYYGLTDNAFWTTLKHRLSPAVTPIWTGSWALSQTITVRQVATVERDMGHRVLIWDNYPVNDFTYVINKHPELFMGPLVGRGAGVPSLVAGYLFNPMIQARASEIALWTAGAYLANPAHYDPAQAWRQAIRAIGGPASGALALFAADNSSYFDENLQPPRLAADMSAFWHERASGADLAKTPLARDFAAMSAVNGTLAARLPDHALYKEIAPWARLLSFQGSAGLYAISALQTAGKHSLSSARRAVILRDLDQLRRNPLITAGAVTQNFLAAVLSTSDPPAAG